MKNMRKNHLTILISLIMCTLYTPLKASEFELIVKAKGSKAHGVYSHFEVFVNGLSCGHKNASQNYEEYVFSIPFALSEVDEVKIVFDNDMYTLGEDRNLCVHSILLDDEIPIRAHQESVKFTCDNGVERPYCGMMEWNGALTFDIKKLKFHQGNVVLSSQEQVNQFTSQYVEGSLTIAGDDITDLSPLAGLCSVKGALIIQDNANLVDISGLNSVVELDFLKIENNPKLIRINGLSSVEECGGMHIHNNKTLRTINCFIPPEM